MIVERLSDNYPKSEVAASLDALEERLLPLRHAVRHHGVDRRRQDAEGQAGSCSTATRPRPTRSRRSSVAASSPTASAASRRTRIWTDATAEVQKAMEARVQGAAVQPDRHDGRLGRPREHDPDAPDRRHAWPRGQPPWRHDPASDQVELPRGSRDARVLHRHARRPQGSGRHGAAYRRLRLPHPSSRRRRPGADHPRGGLRHQPRCLGRARRARHAEPAHVPRDEAVRPGPARRRHARRRHEARAQHDARRRRGRPAPRRPRGRPRPRAARCSRAMPSSASAPCATAVRWPPAS